MKGNNKMPNMMRHCPDCGKRVTNKSNYCDRCFWNHGSVYFIDMSKPIDDWKWEKKVTEND